MSASRTVSGPCQGHAVGIDVQGKAPQVSEDALRRLVFSAQLYTVALRDGYGDLEGINRIEAEPIAKQRRLGKEAVGRHG